ncbi:hypothetical protein [Rhodopseudomonas sp. BR0G17]|uniref:hypothetical protein n=1 Tax=Rhodopseudomonas sp. BR0G17 TaxID=2269368 RepID=UPI0013DF700D|nr:hypothetical protein [Rhodopseudomonas sp. BR0G17]NEW95488.1 hypothetical protein [Rhodopseudomonas sp. BR0G17]
MSDSNIILPSIGRVVWFHPAAQANPNGQPHAALIAYVQSERLINLAAFDENGTSYSATSVPLLQGDEAPPTDGTAYAEWMPFQKGQAAKTDNVAAGVRDRLDAFEKSVDDRFRQTGDFLTKKFAEVDGKLAQPAVTVTGDTAVELVGVPSPMPAELAQPSAQPSGQ